MVRSILACIIFVCITSSALLFDDYFVVYSGDSIKTRKLVTWQGDFSFESERIVCISKMKDIHVLKYRCSKSHVVGNLIEIAIQNQTNAELELICHANTELMGVTPEFDGLDVFAHGSSAELILRWKHPGQGGLRTVEKYSYKNGKIVFIESSSLYFDTDGCAVWKLDNSSDDPMMKSP